MSRTELPQYRTADRPVHYRRAGLVAGLAGAVAQVVVAAVLHTVVPPVPFLPVALAQSLVRATPGGVATFFIDRLGHSALPLAIAGTSVAFLVVGAALGLLIAELEEAFGDRSFPAAVAALIPLWVAGVLLYPSMSPQSVGRLAF